MHDRADAACGGRGPSARFLFRCGLTKTTPPSPPSTEDTVTRPRYMPRGASARRMSNMSPLHTAGDGGLEAGLDGVDGGAGQNKGRETILYLIFDYMDTDLNKFICDHRQSHENIPAHIVKILMYQPCKGVPSAMAARWNVTCRWYDSSSETSWVRAHLAINR